MYNNVDIENILDMFECSKDQVDDHHKLNRKKIFRQILTSNVYLVESLTDPYYISIVKEINSED